MNHPLARPLQLNSLAILGLAIALLPLAAVTYPPFLDYPSQLARTFITQNIESFSLFYELAPSLPANLAGEFLIQLFETILPIENAGLVFIAVTLIIQVTGVAALNFALWRSTDLSTPFVLATLFAFGWTLQMGFLNYLLGIGILLWSVSIILLTEEKRWPFRLLLALIIGSTIAFVHVIALVLLIVILVGLRLQSALMGKSWRLLFHNSETLVALLTIIALTLVTRINAEGGPPVWDWGLRGKVSQAIASADMGLPDEWCAIGIMVFLSGTLFYTASIRFKPTMALPVILLVTVYILAPSKVAGGAHLDDRIPIAILLLILASTRIVFSTRQKLHFFSALILALLIARASYQISDYSRFDADARTILNAIAKVPDNAVLMLMVDGTHPLAGWSARQRRMWHVPSLAALGKPVFVPTTHALYLQHTIIARDEWQPLYADLRNLPSWITNADDMNRSLAKLHGGIAKAKRSMPDETFPVYTLMLLPHHMRTHLANYGNVITAQRDFMLVRIPFTRGDST